MSLKINQLTKIYGQQRAVNNISFEVQNGEIAGFLGPNGAGKSTTMKIISCYLPLTEGEVIVNGHNVATHSMQVRRVLGYLPESNPLYKDLYIMEYLEFAGGFYGLRGKTLKNRVEEIIELCGLTPERGKRIEQLSKGYKQRVGLAQALLHDPEVLILDEPTSGLDPNQLVEIRKLIKEISKNKTVLFSTHILQEVQALCDRVIVINKGKLVADDSLSSLMNRRKESAVFIAEFQHEIDRQVMLSIPEVREVQDAGPGIYKIFSSGGSDLRSALFRLASEKNLPLVGLKQEESSLEEVFASLTRNVD